MEKILRTNKLDADLNSTLASKECKHRFRTFKNYLGEIPRAATDSEKLKCLLQENRGAAVSENKFTQVTMAVDDFKTEAGLKSLNTYLTDRSFVSGFQASQADVSVFEALAKPPSADTPHVLRWYNHIKSYGSERSKLPGEKKFPDLFSSSAVGNGSAPPAKEDDDDVDLFGSDEEDDTEAAKIREERLKAYSEKKAKKPALIAKSSIVLDVKPWDDETDMKEMEVKVRTIQMDGLLWGASKLVPVGYGINKLQIMCVVEDEKVSVDLLVEEIQNFEDYVQSVDIAAFNKI